MSTQENILWQLQQVRLLSEGLLAEFKTPEEWVFQVHPKTNHALWLTGHIALVDNFVISGLASDRALPRAEFADKFNMGTAPIADASQYPPIDEVREYFRERRETLVEIAAGLDDEALAQKPGRAPPFVNTVGELLLFVSIHEGVHAGQIAVQRRAQGKKPLFGTVPD